MAQVILIYPELVREGDPAALIMPLSLVYVAYPLTRYGYSVRIIDQRVSPNWAIELREELLKGETICVGISAMTGLQIEGGIFAAKVVREYSHDLPVVWGGVHPSLLPEQTVEDEHVDIVVIGEGEQTFLEVVQRAEPHRSFSDIKGLCYKQNRKTILTPPRAHVDLHDIDISCLPYDLLGNADRYLANPLAYLPSAEKRCVGFLTSRGCPSRCTYCYNVRFNARRWRAYEPERVVEDLEYITAKFGIKGLFLLDDNFFTSVRRVQRICELIVDRSVHVRFYNVNCRLDTLSKLDESFLILLKKAGIHSLFIGVESGSTRVLRAIGKSLNIHDISETDRKLQSADIIPTYSFMIGLPVESRDDIKKTLFLMSQIIDRNPNACISPQTYIPLPGSELFDVCVGKGLVAPERLSEWAHFCENYPRDLEGYRWFDKKDREFLKKVVIMMQVIDTKKNQRKAAWMESLRRLYSRIVRSRIRYNFYAFMPELRLREVDFLKLKEKG